MDRTVPSFRIAFAMEKKEGKPFRIALDKKDRKEFDGMWDIPKLYISACSNSVQLVPLHPIIISILFHHYKELLECIDPLVHPAIFFLNILTAVIGVDTVGGSGGVQLT